MISTKTIENTMISNTISSVRNTEPVVTGTVGSCNVGRGVSARFSSEERPNESESKHLAKQYQKKTDRQHILDNPDTYIGSVENVDANMWVFDDSLQKIILKQIEYIPGLYKLFDEGIVNCRDHVIRMIPSSLIVVSI